MPLTDIELAVARRMASMRRRTRLTLAESAKKSGLTIDMVHRIEHGLQRGSLAQLQALSAAYGSSLETLLRNARRELVAKTHTATATNPDEQRG